MKIGIIGAMDLETELLKNRMTDIQVKEVAGLFFFNGKLMDKQTVVVTCGIGKTNAALCTQILISEFHVTHLINTGVSGAIHNDLNVGDLVISTDCMHHDFDCTGFGYEHGIIPRMSTSVFEADTHLVELAFKASTDVIADQKVMKGRIVSGDQFISSMAKKEFIETTFAALTTEMESASIAHTAVLNRIPYVIIRGMSDKADGSAHVNFDEFAKKAADNSSQIVMAMLKAM